MAGYSIAEMKEEEMNVIETSCVRVTTTTEDGDWLSILRWWEIFENQREVRQSAHTDQQNKHRTM